MELSREDKILVQKVINKLDRGLNSDFLDPREQKVLIPILNREKINYQIYYPYDDSDKVIFYSYDIPEVVLFEIKAYKKLEHRQILGSLFAYAIDSHLFGDIIVAEKTYIMTTMDGARIMEYGFNEVGHEKVKLIRTDIQALANYKREYEDINLKVNSLRIDLVCSKLIHKSRSDINTLIKDKSVILNYDVLKNNSYLLKENDILSIRKYGKYKYLGIKEKCKNNSLIINLQKYI